MNAPAYMAARRPLVENYLQRRVPAATAAPAPLHRAMRHLLFPGGKRLRPALAFAACEAAGAAPAAATPAAAAVELLHSYSLIHDDLPCMDNDDFRRGRPSTHRAFGESTALLAGDALQTLAFEILAEAAASQAAAIAMREIAHAAGSLQLVGGQVADLAFAKNAAAEKTAAAELVEEIHARKSAALISAALSAGARFGGATELQAAALAKFGLELGVAFQITDDLLDQNDEACSLVTVLGESAARARAQTRLQNALAHLERAQLQNPGKSVLREIARYAVERKA